MNLVVGFAPFILFAFLSRLSADLALWVAFAAAFVVTIRDFVESPSLRLLDVGCLVLFALLALWRGFLDPSLSLPMVRFIAEAALFLLLGGSLPDPAAFLGGLCAAGSAGSGLAAAAVPQGELSGFRRWTAAFVAMAVADGAVALMPRLPLYGSIAVSVIALAAGRHLHPALSGTGSQTR